MVVLDNSNKVAEVKEEEMDNWIANDVCDKVRDICLWDGLLQRRWKQEECT